MSRKPKPGL